MNEPVNIEVNIEACILSKLAHAGGVFIVIQRYTNPLIWNKIRANQKRFFLYFVYGNSVHQHYN